MSFQSPVPNVTTRRHTGVEYPATPAQQRTTRAREPSMSPGRIAVEAVEKVASRAVEFAQTSAQIAFEELLVGAQRTLDHLRYTAKVTWLAPNWNWTRIYLVVAGVFPHIAAGKHVEVVAERETLKAAKSAWAENQKTIQEVAFKLGMVAYDMDILRGLEPVSARTGWMLGCTLEGPGANHPIFTSNGYGMSLYRLFDCLALGLRVVWKKLETKVKGLESYRDEATKIAMGMEERLVVRDIFEDSPLAESLQEGDEIVSVTYQEGNSTPKTYRADSYTGRMKILWLFNHGSEEMRAGVEPKLSIEVRRGEATVTVSDIAPKPVHAYPVDYMPSSTSTSIYAYYDFFAVLRVFLGQSTAIRRIAVSEQAMRNFKYVSYANTELTNEKALLAFLIGRKMHDHDHLLTLRLFVIGQILETMLWFIGSLPKAFMAREMSRGMDQAGFFLTRNAKIEGWEQIPAAWMQLSLLWAVRPFWSWLISIRGWLDPRPTVVQRVADLNTMAHKVPSWEDKPEIILPEKFEPRRSATRRLEGETDAGPATATEVNG